MHSHSCQDIHQSAVELVHLGHDCVLVTVLEANGSTPCKAGSKAIMDARGVIHGTVGGGQVEAEAQRRVVEAIETGCPSVLDCDLHSGTVDDGRPICGGRMRVLLDPTHSRNRAAYHSASATRQSRRRGVLLTTIRSGQTLEVAVEFLEEETIATREGFPKADTIASVLEREEPKLVVDELSPGEDRLETLVEPIVPAPVLLIVGGGHVGQAVATQASLVGFDLVIIDDRPEFTRPELYPAGATVHCDEIRKAVADYPIDENTYIVIVTRGHDHDAEALAACIRRPAAYVGVIGSQRKVGLMRKAFVESGQASSGEFERVFAPIGLEIGSVTVPEIATSIVAQLVAVRRTGSSPRIPARYAP